jgi:hypothetical protein
MRIALCLVLAATVLPVSGAEHATLTGKVVDSTGAVLENATVLIYKAGVKTGYSTYCPTCYVDCGKHTTTTADGTFQLNGLSPDLLFTILVLHPGHATATVDAVNPEKGFTAPVALKPREAVQDLARLVRGRVVDLQGRPSPGAVVEQQGVIFSNGGQSYGPGGWVDLLSVTNQKGEFEMAYEKPAAKMILSVAARGMAPKLVTVPTGAEQQTITVAEGATVRGRLVYKGKPVSKAEVGLLSHSRGSGTSYPEVRIGTQDDGTFAITNVPAGRVWVAYPKMQSLAERNLGGRPSALETKDNGEDVNVGDIELAPSYKVSGQVVLTDGKPIPAGMRISLSAENSFDSQTAQLPPDGKFEFRGVPAGVHTLNPSLKGYEFPEGYEQETLINADRKVMIQLRPRAR